MRVSLDTSAYSALDRGHEGVREVLETADQICLPVIVIGELLSGFALGTRAKRNRSELGRFLTQPGVTVGAIDATTADRYGEIVQWLRANGTPLPTNDIWIAAHAMQHGFQLVTTDRHFAKVPQVSTLLFDP